MPVVGITSLQLEHTDRLGNTLSEIAWNKAGIMKPGCMAFTTNGQAAEALDVLKETATEVDVSYFIPILVMSPAPSTNFKELCI